jgi:hypothetical protein
MRIAITFLFALSLLGGAVYAQQDRPAEFVDGAKIQFVNTVHDFGENPQGTPVSCAFVFKNVGNAPLVLQNVKASCGCTTPFWPKEPIMPGQESKIDVKYNMARAGNFTKTITVTVKPENPEETGEIVKLTIKGSAVAAATEGSVEEVRPSIITNPNLGDD